MPGAYSTRSAPIQATWSGANSVLLTGSYVASDAIQLPFVKRFTVYPRYKAGTAETGNTLDFIIETNPFDATTDSAGAYWTPVGNYLDTSGSYAEEVSTGNVYHVAQGTAGSYRNGVSVSLSNVDALQMRIKVQETGVASNYGTIQLTVVKNEIS